MRLITMDKRAKVVLYVPIVLLVAMMITAGIVITQLEPSGRTVSNTVENGNNAVIFINRLLMRLGR